MGKITIFLIINFILIVSGFPGRGVYYGQYMQPYDQRIMYMHYMQPRNNFGYSVAASSSNNQPITYTDDNTSAVAIAYPSTEDEENISKLEHENKFEEEEELIYNNPLNPPEKNLKPPTTTTIIDEPLYINDNDNNNNDNDNYNNSNNNNNENGGDINLDSTTILYDNQNDEHNNIPNLNLIPNREYLVPTTTVKTIQNQLPKKRIRVELDEPQNNGIYHKKHYQKQYNKGTSSSSSSSSLGKGNNSKPQIPSGTFFPINFGGTSGGSIAIANSFSTGDGGSATSHAIAYGNPHGQERQVLLKRNRLQASKMQ